MKMKILKDKFCLSRLMYSILTNKDSSLRYLLSSRDDKKIVLIKKLSKIKFQRVKMGPFKKKLIKMMLLQQMMIKLKSKSYFRQVKFNLKVSLKFKKLLMA